MAERNVVLPAHRYPPACSTPLGSHHSVAVTVVVRHAPILYRDGDGRLRVDHSGGLEQLRSILDDRRSNSESG